jgi:hypothetical protein
MVIHRVRSRVSAEKKKLRHVFSQMSKQLVAQVFSGEILAYTLTVLAGISMKSLKLQMWDSLNSTNLKLAYTLNSSCRNLNEVTETTNVGQS